MHIYGNGVHGSQDHNDEAGGISFATWSARLMDWMKDLGFTSKIEKKTKVAADVKAYTVARGV
jgi:hypothetical protein